MKAIALPIFLCAIALSAPSAQAAQVPTPGSLTTTFVSDNAFGGNMFDLSPSVDMEITGLALNCTNQGTIVRVDVWHRDGTSVGFESSSTGWTLLGNFAGVSGGRDNPTYVNLQGGGLTLLGGSTTGIYVDLTSYPTQEMRYTISAQGGDEFDNAELTLVTNAGLADGGFGASVFADRIWNGTVYYEALATPPADLSVSGSCPGWMTMRIEGATRNGSVGLVFGTAGSFTIGTGPCAGVVLDIANPSMAFLLNCDAQGDATLGMLVPAGACGLTLQGIDLSGCVATNSVVL